MSELQLLPEASVHFLCEWLIVARHGNLEVAYVLAVTHGSLLLLATFPRHMGIF